MYIYIDRYVFFSKLKCLLQILYIMFAAQNTTLRSTPWARLNPLTVTKITAITHHGLDRQMTIKAVHANHIPKWMNGEWPSPRNKPAATAELQMTRGVGVCSQGQGVAQTSLPSQSNEWLAILQVSFPPQDSFLSLLFGTKSTWVTLISCYQSSSSLLLFIVKKIGSFIFDLKLFSWG